MGLKRPDARGIAKHDLRLLQLKFLAGWPIDSKHRWIGASNLAAFAEHSPDQLAELYREAVAAKVEARLVWLRKTLKKQAKKERIFLLQKAKKAADDEKLGQARLLDVDALARTLQTQIFLEVLANASIPQAMAGRLQALSGELAGEHAGEAADEKAASFGSQKFAAWKREQAAGLSKYLADFFGEPVQKTQRPQRERKPATRPQSERKPATQQRARAQLAEQPSLLGTAKKNRPGQQARRA